jgi:transposase
LYIILGALLAMPVFKRVTLTVLTVIKECFLMSKNSTNEAEADYYLGVDVAKSKLDVSLIESRSGRELTHKIVANSTEAIGLLLEDCLANYSGSLQCVAEATSTYHFNLLYAAEELGIPVRVYNPIITKSGIKASVRGKKTDRTDALLIARMGLRGEGRIHIPEDYRTVKYYARGCQKLSVMDSAFSKYKTHFTELLEGEVTPEFTELLSGVKKAITEARSRLYKDTATSAQGTSFRLLQTIPGVGPYIASSIIGEIQDIKRFNSSKALIAYAGLDPRIRQSGKALNSTGRLTKRGSSYLRRSLFIAANVARMHDAQFKALYDKKRAEGKTFKVANCVVARKLVKVVWSVWKNGKDYTVPEETKA